ncbi:two-component sensor histidine kinase, partial [Micromonospora chalcea]
MSSSPPSDARGRLRRRLAGWSLRRRLVLSVVALLALVSLGIGGLTTVALRHFLINQIDNQLTFGDRRPDDLERWARRGMDPPRPDQRPTPPDSDEVAPAPPGGFPPGSIAVRVPATAEPVGRIRSGNGDSEE